MAESKIFMETNVKCHVASFLWEINNALGISDTIVFGETFSVYSKCGIKLRSAVKLSNRDTLFVGFKRVDSFRKSPTMVTDLKICDSNGDTLTRQTLKFLFSKRKTKLKNNVHWCISERFTNCDHKPDSPEQAIFCNSDNSSSSTLNAGEVKKLSGASVTVKGTLKMYGCCINSRVKANLNSSEIAMNELGVTTVGEVTADLRLAHETNHYADVKLKVQGFDISAHKFILAARCPYFNKFLSENGSPDTIPIDDMNKRTFDSFLRYLYTGIVGEVKWKTVSELYSISDKYEVPLLKKNCSQVMKDMLKFTNACDALELADKYNDPRLKIHAIHFICCHFENPIVANSFSELIKHNPELASNVLSLKSLKNLST